jgi:ABC-type lipoprotein release transport system permease subunit
MEATWLVAGTDLRHRWRSFLSVIVVAGLGCAFAVTAGIGARRTWTAWTRLRAATLAADTIFNAPPDADPAIARRVLRLPEVAAAGAFTYTPVAPAPLVPGQDAGAFIALDRSFGTKVYRPLIIKGRRADPTNANEVTINEALAAKGVHVGQRVRLRAGFGDKAKEIASATIVGIERGEFDLGVNSGNAVVELNNAFLQAHRDELDLGPQPATLVRLRDGAAGRTHFAKTLEGLYGRPGLVPVGDPLGDPVEAVLKVQRIAWALLTAAATLAILLALGQALVRLVAPMGDAAPTLRALGLRRPQLLATGAIEGLVVAIGVAVIGLTGGVLASPLVPSGLARRADPVNGIRVEPVVLALAAAVIVVLLTLAGVVGSWRFARESGPTRRGSTRSPVRGSAPLTLGSRWAIGAPVTRPSGASAGSAVAASAGVAARSAIVAVAVGLAGLVAVLTFASSVSRLRATPRLYGWGFDGVFSTNDLGPEELLQRFPRLAADRDVAAVGVGSIIDFIVDGAGVEALAFDEVKGNLHPTILEGRAPGDGLEIALGSGTLRSLHKHVGDTVEVLGPSGSRRVKVVGRAAYPEIGDNGDVLHSASVRSAVGRALTPDAVSAVVLFRVRDGVKPSTVLRRHGGGEGYESVLAFRPRNVDNLSAIGGVPWTLAGFLALLGLAAVGHALVMSVRGRRREIAVLRAIGLVRRQVGATVAVQATATALVGMVIGVPTGIAAGRAGWALVTEGLGVVNQPVVAIGTIVAVLGAAVVVANLASSGPAVAATRVRPAEALRSE